MSKFDNVGNDADTKILFSNPAKFGEYDVLYQKWKFDGITGESLIFANEDLENVNIDELKNEIEQSPLVNNSSREITTSKNNGFIFYSFNFTTDDQ